MAPDQCLRQCQILNGGDVVDKDRVKGKMDDAAGRAKRQVGEWTGDTKSQVEGAAQQVKGKVENAWGKQRTRYVMPRTTSSVLMTLRSVSMTVTTRPKAIAKKTWHSLRRSDRTAWQAPERAPFAYRDFAI